MQLHLGINSQSQTFHKSEFHNIFSELINDKDAELNYVSGAQIQYIMVQKQFLKKNKN